MRGSAAANRVLRDALELCMGLRVSGAPPSEVLDSAELRLVMDILPMSCNMPQFCDMTCDGASLPKAACGTPAAEGERPGTAHAS